MGVYYLVPLVSDTQMGIPADDDNMYQQRIHMPIRGFSLERYRQKPIITRKINPQGSVAARLILRTVIFFKKSKHFLR